MSEERTISTPVSSDDRIRRASSPCTSVSAPPSGRSSAKNWLHASTWKERYLMEPIKRTSPISTPNETSTSATITGESVETDIAHRDEVPIDFSMKKRKSTSGVETRISTSPLRDDDILSTADVASPTYGLMKAFLERRASSPNRRIDADAESAPTDSSPFCLSNRRASSNLLLGPTGAFPLSLAAAAAAAAVVNANCNSQQQNVGASSANNRRHYLTQQLLQRHDHQNQSLDDFGSNGATDNGNGDGVRSQSSNDCPTTIGASERQIPALGACTPVTPPAFFPGGIHSTQNGHQAVSNRNSQQKVQRPFKAYNPMDPMSALQVGAALTPSALPFLNAALAPTTVGSSSPSPHLLLPNPLSSPTAATSSNALPPLLNAQLISQYRQYLINAQAAAAVAALRAKSNQHIQQQLHHSPQRQGQRQQVQQSQDAMATSIGGQIASSVSSQSPPQVTSTSHPHTAESSSSASSAASPPSPNRLASAVPNDNTVASVIMAATNNRIRNQLQQSKPSNGTDRRISSGSGSGGSSFNGADEDDEELLHEDDDGVSNRTSPTPSCASSTALRRTSILGNGDGAGICVGGAGEHQNGSNGTASKSENGSNGAGGRRKGRSLPDSLKDEAYWERRRKNNEAAKRSRDARRAKEDEIAIRAALLEQENMRLRIEVAALKAETDKLRQMLLNT